MEPIWKYEDYNAWSRQMAKIHSVKELEDMLYGASTDLTKSTASHLKAVEKSTSMQSNSQRRAQARNVVSGNWEKKNAIENALEIHRFYPEQAKKEASLIKKH